jgi:hypothetical protein
MSASLEELARVLIQHQTSHNDGFRFRRPKSSSKGKVMKKILAALVLAAFAASTYAAEATDSTKTTKKAKKHVKKHAKKAKAAKADSAAK